MNKPVSILTKNSLLPVKHYDQIQNLMPLSTIHHKTHCMGDIREKREGVRDNDLSPASNESLITTIRVRFQGEV
jgi:hypothetical protein